MRRSLLALVIACALAGCHDSPVSPALAPLVGEWTNTSSVNRDGSVYRTTLSLRADATYVRDWRAYVAVANGGLGDAFAYVTMEGTFSVRGDSIFMRPMVERDWDRDFFGGVVRVTQITGGKYDQGGARFDILGETLFLHYLSYPADAPVEATEALLRVR